MTKRIAIAECHRRAGPRCRRRNSVPGKHPQFAMSLVISRNASQQSRLTEDCGCLQTFNSSSLHMAACQTEQGDKTTPNQSGCTDGNCRFSGILYQLWYINSLGQMSSAITNIENGRNQLLPMIKNFPANTPWCLATGACTRLQHSMPLWKLACLGEQKANKSHGSDHPDCDCVDVRCCPQRPTRPHRRRRRRQLWTRRCRCRSGLGRSPVETAWC